MSTNDNVEHMFCQSLFDRYNCNIILEVFVMSQVALSTMWMMNRHKSLAEFFEAADEIGFERYELNHFVSQELVNDAKFPSDAITSVHAPCPTNPRTQEAQVSALDKEERALAIEAVAASISLAERIGAQVVILHPGDVPVNPELEKELRSLYNQGKQGSPRYVDARSELVEQRARNAERHLDATRRSLERLASIADSAGVRIGLENRFFYSEIPLPDELDLLLREFAGPVGFWLDTGHAYTLEALGFVRHTEWLNGFSQHLVGVHLHDVQVVSQQQSSPDQPPTPSETTRLRDHVIPGTGVVDFSETLRRVNSSALLTCEFDWYHSAEQVRAGLDYLRQVKREGAS
jgi:sugar phosphate isomerase/epimerase